MYKIKKFAAAKLRRCEAPPTAISSKKTKQSCRKSSPYHLYKVWF